MPYLSRLLFVVLALRLLAPQGVCLCHALNLEEADHGGPGDELPAAPHEDDHVPGCPSSKTAGDYASFAGPTLPDLPLLACLPVSPDVPAVAEVPVSAPVSTFAHPSERPIFLMVRALLI